MEKKKALKKLLVMFTLLTIVLVLTGCGKSDKSDKKSSKDYTAPVENFFKGMEKADAKTYLKSFHKFVIDYMDYNEDDVQESLDYMLENFEDEYGDNIKITYEITSEEQIGKDDLKNVQEYIKEYYDKDVNVSDGYELKIKAIIKGDDEEETDNDKFYVYEIDGEWGYLQVSPDDAASYLE